MSNVYAREDDTVHSDPYVIVYYDRTRRLRTAGISSGDDINWMTVDVGNFSVGTYHDAPADRDPSLGKNRSSIDNCVISDLNHAMLSSRKHTRQALTETREIG